MVSALVEKTMLIVLNMVLFCFIGYAITRVLAPEVIVTEPIIGGPWPG